MERYAPTLMDLAPRDMVVARIYMEIREGRGIGGKDYVHLDLTHLGKEVIDEKLPDITEFARVYQGIEPITQPVPIQPTAHYAMGGIPTNIDARVVIDEQEHGRCPASTRRGSARACRVHGANRLGTNSLIDILVFGRRAGRANGRGRAPAAELAASCRPMPRSRCAARSRPCAARPRGENAQPASALELADVMMDDCGVFRTARDAARDDRRRARTAGSLRRRRGERHGPRLQHGPARGARGGLPARLRRGDSRGGAGPHESRAAAIPARTSPSATTPTGSSTRWPTAPKAGRELRYKPVTITKFEPKPRTY